MSFSFQINQTNKSKCKCRMNCKFVNVGLIVNFYVYMTEIVQQKTES